MWTACYAPDDSLTTHGFFTEQEAWGYVHANMCDSCKTAYESFKKGLLPENREDWEWDYGSCEAEWFVMPTAEYEK